ncbi:MAG: hypothetical protein ACRDP6_20665 [Actinoallomurus sp.]
MTVEQLAELFREQAGERDRRRMPTLTNLARTIRGHEAGEHPPGPLYRMRYAKALRLDMGELSGTEKDNRNPPWRAPAAELNGQFTPDDEQRLIAAASRPARIDQTVVDSLATILAEQRRLEDAIGSAPVLHVVRAQLQTLAGMVTEARGPLRPEVVDVAGQWNQFSGWLHIAIGDRAAARTSLDRAAEYAQEIGDTGMAGTVLSWKAHLAERAGQVGPMIGMSSAARRDRRGPGRAYDIFQEARGYALAGEPSRALRLLGEAQDAAAAADGRDARPWEYYYLQPGFFELETGLTYVYLGRDDPGQNALAVEHLTAGLTALPAGMRRSEWAGEYISHKAVAHLQAGEAEAARAAVMDAANVARSTSSAALLDKLRGIHHRMRAAWPDDSGVVELGDVLL